MKKKLDYFFVFHLFIYAFSKYLLFNSNFHPISKDDFDFLIMGLFQHSEDLIYVYMKPSCGFMNIH